MKWLVTLAWLCTISCGTPANAEMNIWMILAKGDGLELVHAIGPGKQSSVLLGNSAFFGADDGRVAVFTRSAGMDHGDLMLFSSQSGARGLTWPVKSMPAIQLSDPTPDLVFIGDSAYFVSIADVEPDGSRPRGSLGGLFALNRVSTKDGSVEKIPLPAECANPRIIAFNGTLVVYSWNGDTAWKLNSAQNELEGVIAAADVKARGDSVEQLVYDEKRNFADFVAIPSLGIFRLSANGVLSRYLDANLSSRTPQKSEKAITIAGKIIRVFAAKFNLRPVAAALVEVQDRLEIAYYDPESGIQVSRFEISKDALSDSLFSLPDDSLAYIDTKTGWVMRRTPSGETQALWNIKSAAPDAVVYQSRIAKLEF